MGAWLSESNASMSQIDHFLKLEYVILFFFILNGTLLTFCCRLRSREVSHSAPAQELHTKIAMLPKPPAWKSCVVSVEGGTTKEPLVLFYRDGLEVFKFLFGNPLFEQLQDYVPTKIWADYENDIRIFEGPFTGGPHFRNQVSSFTSAMNSRSFLSRACLERSRSWRDARLGHDKFRRNSSDEHFWR